MTRQTAWLAAALAYFVAVTLAHLPVSLWLVRRRSGPWGDYRIADALPALLIAGAVVLCLWIARDLLRARRPGILAAAWLTWAAGVFATDRWLTFSLPEYAHYPQYALLAWLFACALDPRGARCIPGRILFWTTLCGGLDELAQYLWTTTSYSEYFDFNDVFVNLLAAAAGTLLYYGRPRAITPARPARVETATLAAIAAAVVIALSSGHLATTPPPGVKVPPGGLLAPPDGAYRLYLQRSHPGSYATHGTGPYRGRYWILDPLSGLLLTFGFGGAFAWLIGRAQVPPGTRRTLP